jgi:uncharacterized membrane protein
MSIITILIIAAVFLAGLALGAFIIWVVLRRRKTSPAPEKAAPAAQFKPNVEMSKTQATQAFPLAFRWSYVAAPISLAIICLIIAVAFVSYLPSPLGFRFNSDGAVRMFMNTYTFIALMIAAQIVCALAAWGIANTIISMGHNAFKTSQPQVSLDAYISLTSNMVLLPQMILAYIMLDAFIYGVWTRHIVSVGLFSILTIVIGSLILIFMFMRLLSHTNSALNKQ